VPRVNSTEAVLYAWFRKQREAFLREDEPIAAVILRVEHLEMPRVVEIPSIGKAHTC